MDYLIINPMQGQNTGIDNYTRYLTELSKLNVVVLNNINNLPPVEFRKYVKNHIEINYGFDEVIIESPEAKAATLLLNKNYKVHIRLHCPLSVAQKYDGFQVDQNEYSNELRVINKAWKVSSPSHGLLEELQNELYIEPYRVYPNPAPKFNEEELEKDIDILFIGRFQKLKGIESLNPILELTKSDKNVFLVGSGAENFKLSSSISCNLTVLPHVEGALKDSLFARAKNVLLLSEFENCSMVLLESIANCARVIAWNVGGNKELSDGHCVVSVKKGDYWSLIDIINNYSLPKTKKFKQYWEKNQFNFLNGLESITTENTFKNEIVPINNLHKVINNQNLDNIRNKDIKVFGFTISNEHIEEMWMPMVKSIQADYYFVCRRSLGQHSKFNKKYPVDISKFIQYDWINEPHRLLGEIAREKPDFLLFHNGLHPMYQDVLQMVKSIGIPIVYSELGWFPQDNNVYFDLQGVNAFSSIANDKLVHDGNKNEKILTGNVLLCLQLENDTNIMLSSNRFKKNINLINYVLEQLPQESIIIRPHPLDKTIYNCDDFSFKEVTIENNISLEEQISSAKAVIALNSTVLLNALDYDLNIYALGNGIANNKPGIIDASNVELRTVWSDSLQFNKEERQKTKDYFLERQFSTLELLDNKNTNLPTSLNFLTQIYFSDERKDLYTKKTLLLKKEYLKRTSKFIAPRHSSEALMSTASSKNTSVFKRKLAKFKKNPKKFFIDSQYKIFNRFGE